MQLQNSKLKVALYMCVSFRVPEVHSETQSQHIFALHIAIKCRIPLLKILRPLRLWRIETQEPAAEEHMACGRLRGLKKALSCRCASTPIFKDVRRTYSSGSAAAAASASFGESLEVALRNICRSAVIHVE